MHAELSDNAWSEPVTRVRVLVADDDNGVRAHFVSLLGDAIGIASILEAEDGAEAVQVGLQLRPEIAVLDLNMPRLSGVEVANTLSTLQPSMRIALRSSDPDDLRARAGGLGLPLFDKLECERLVHWVETQARARPLGLARVIGLGSRGGVISTAHFVVTASLAASLRSAAQCATSTQPGRNRGRGWRGRRRRTASSLNSPGSISTRGWAVSSRSGCEREQQTRLLKPTDRVCVIGIKHDQRALVAGGSVLADRKKDTSAENLDEDAVAVPRITDLFVLREVD